MKRPDLRQFVTVHPDFVAAHYSFGVRYYPGPSRRPRLWPPAVVEELLCTKLGGTEIALTPKDIEFIRSRAAEAMGYHGPLFATCQPVVDWLRERAAAEAEAMQ